MDSLREPLVTNMAGGAPVDGLLAALAKADAFAARSAAEAARARLGAIEILADWIGGRGLDDAARDRLAACPWIMGPGWDAFAADGDATALAREAARTAGLPDCGGRLALAPPMRRAAADHGDDGAGEAAGLGLCGSLRQVRADDKDRPRGRRAPLGMRGPHSRGLH